MYILTVCSERKAQWVSKYRQTNAVDTYGRLAKLK